MLGMLRLGMVIRFLGAACLIRSAKLAFPAPAGESTERAKVPLRALNAQGGEPSRFSCRRFVGGVTG